MRTDVDQQTPPQVSRPAKAAAAASRWLSYLTVNPISALAAFALTSGGLLVLIFFLRIGFMPDVDLSTSTALLFAVALVGLGTVIVYMLVAVLPGVVTAYALGEYKIPPSPWTLASVMGSGVVMALVIMADVWLDKGRLLRSGSWLGWLFAILVMARVWDYRSCEIPRVSWLARPFCCAARFMQTCQRDHVRSKDYEYPRRPMRCCSASEAATLGFGRASVGLT